MPSTKILRARQLRETSGWAERLLWKWLRDRRFSSYKFRRQHPVGPYTLDFFCEQAQLSIELDGGQHGFPENQAHDEQRTRYLDRLGIKELRFWNSRLRTDPQTIRRTIFEALNARAPNRNEPVATERPKTKLRGKTTHANLSLPTRPLSSGRGPG